MRSILLISLFTIGLFSLCHCKDISYPFQSKCKVVGDPNLLKLYEDNNYPTFRSLIEYLPINETRFTIGYCECSTETGNCYIEYDAKKNDTYHKVIIEYVMLTDIKNKTSESVYAEYKKYIDEKRKEFYYYGEMEEKLIPPMPETYVNDPKVDSIYFTNNKISIYEEDGFTNLETVKSVSSPKDLLEERIEEGKRLTESYYPLKYAPNIPSNEDEQTSITIGKYDIGNVIECISEDKDFKNGNVTKNVYTKKDFKPSNLDCSWGNPSIVMDKITTTSDSNKIFESNLLMMFISLFLTFLFI